MQGVGGHRNEREDEKHGAVGMRQGEIFYKGG
jgi:hypothetical protein